MRSTSRAGRSEKNSQYLREVRFYETETETVSERSRILPVIHVESFAQFLVRFLSYITEINIPLQAVDVFVLINLGEEVVIVVDVRLRSLLSWVEFSVNLTHGTQLCTSDAV